MGMSGKEMLRMFEKAGWTVSRQRGSHVIIRKGSEVEVVPMHKELKKGLEKALLKRLKEVG